MRCLLIAIAVLLSLTACASKPERKSLSTPAHSTRHGSPAQQAGEQFNNSSVDSEKKDPCAPIYDHDESRYTAGGLYAPELSDSMPANAIDVSKLEEPSPKPEPLARYGNKSPYKVLGKTYYVMDKSDDYDQRGIASWYGQKFNGRKTSSGEIYSICEFTAAHKTLPLPSYVRVTNTKNGHSIVVRVNDRGPFHDGRIIDLSYVAAKRIGLDKTGTAPVRVELLHSDDELTRKTKDTPYRSPNIEASEVSLQFGSFADKDNAERLQDRLQAADIEDVELNKVEVQGQTLWRVLVPSLKNAQLTDIFDKIRQLGLPKPKVISQKL